VAAAEDALRRARKLGGNRLCLAGSPRTSSGEG